MERPLLIAVHGAGMGPGAWDALAGQGLALRALRLPGHGDGGRPLASVAAMAEWVGRQIDAPCVLMGHSMGALVAMETASSHVKALILLGVAGEMPVHPDLLRQAGESPETATELILKWGIFGPDATVRDRLRHAMKDGLSALKTDLAACNDYKLLKDIDKNVLILAAAEDRMVKPAVSEALARLLPHGKFHLLPATGHMMMVENPAACRAAIDEFIKYIQ